MNITLNDTTVVIYCTCGSSDTYAYSALTIGTEQAASTIATTCSSCGASIYLLCPSSRVTTSHLAAHTLFRKAKDAGATIDATWSAADVEALLTGKRGIEDYETLPWDNKTNGAQIYYEAAASEKSSESILDLLNQGVRLYGTESERRGYIEKLATSDAEKKMLFTRNGVQF